MRDYYKTLRISPNATTEEIKHSFRVLAHQFHPDKNSTISSSTLFVEIKEAYDNLVDPINRQQYHDKYKRQFGNYYTSYENTETEYEVKKDSNVDYIFSQLKKFQSSDYQKIVLEELSDSLNDCYSRLGSIKQNNLIKFSSYLDLSSTIVRNALEIAEKLLNDLLTNCIIKPDDVFKKFPPAARYQAVLSWLEDILKHIMAPLEKFEMNSTTREICRLKRQYYEELKTDFEKKANQNETGKGCYIATMVYGSYNHSNVLVLRNYRDTILEKYFLSRLFVSVYYAVSPFLVKLLRNRPLINRIIKSNLDKYVRYLKSKL